jgi:hypothetical protein
MGFDTHMIAGSRACPTSRPAHSPDHHQPVKPALCRDPAGAPDTIALPAVVLGWLGLSVGPIGGGLAAAT